MRLSIFHVPAALPLHLAPQESQRLAKLKGALVSRALGPRLWGLRPVRALFTPRFNSWMALLWWYPWGVTKLRRI
jgi:hypothetical protein